MPTYPPSRAYDVLNKEEKKLILTPFYRPLREAQIAIDNLAHLLITYTPDNLQYVVNAHHEAKLAMDVVNTRLRAFIIQYS